MPVEPTPALQRVTASRLEQATPPDTVQAVAGAPAAAPDSAAVPVYATRIAAPVGLHYALRRDTVTGTAELQWRRQHDEYELLLEGTLLGTAVLSSISRGRIDAHGVAPQRHAER